LKSDFRCIAPDLPGYGPRSKTYELPEAFDYSLPLQVEFVDEVLKALNISEKVTLVVHDIGGIMGVPWAAQNTNRLHAVIYTNTVAFPKFHWFGLARLFGSTSILGKALASVNMDLIGTNHGWVFKNQYAKQNPQLEQSEVDRVTQDFAMNDVAKRTTMRQFREITRLEFFDNYDVMVKKIASEVPTLTLWGDGDPYLKDNHFAEQLYAGKTYILPKVGHWVPIVAAERLSQEIRALHQPAQQQENQPTVGSLP